MSAMNNFFDDDENIDPGPIHNGPVSYPDRQRAHPNDTSDGRERSQRRRKPPQSTITFPSFEDELKEGTLLDAAQTVVPPSPFISQDVPPRTRPRKNFSDGPLSKPARKQTDAGPRKIGSQFLELDRGLAVNVSAINDDIVPLSKEDLRDAIRAADKSSLQRDKLTPAAQATDRIYVERKGKFYALSKRPEEWIETPVANPLNAGLTPSKNSRPNLILYKAARLVFLFSHGLLAGLALFHCIALFYSTPPRQSDWSLFLHFYPPISITFKTIYQALIALCCVSCLCRIDLASGLDLQLLTEHFETITATIFYLCAAAISHLIDVTMMQLLLQTSNSSNALGQLLMDDLALFRILDAVRTGCVGVAWCLVLCRWKHDRMRNHLECKLEK